MSSFGYRHGISGIAQYKLYRLLRDRGSETYPRLGSWLGLMAMGEFLGLLGLLTYLKSTETLFVPWS